MEPPRLTPHPTELADPPPLTEWVNLGDPVAPGVLTRSLVASTAETITALLHCPEVHALGALLPDRSDVGRPRTHPGWSLMLYGALARHYRSAARAQTELNSRLVWQHVQVQARHAAAELGIPVPAAEDPPTWAAWAHARNHTLATDTGLADVARIHLEQAAVIAHQLGLARRDGGGSWSHPARTRTAYGDGTLVTPIYRPPNATRETLPDGTIAIRYPDPHTGELLETPPHRYDPDAAIHHGKGGPVHATNYVAWHVRGASYHQRVILTIGHVDAPGHEADTAVALLGDIRRVLGDDLQAVVYDGAFRGTHLDQVMRRYGYIVISKPGTLAAADTAPAAVRLPTGRTASSYPLGTWHHDTATGPCTHLLAAVNGAVSEIGLDEAGDPTLLAQLDRRQVKRPRRHDGRYHFSIGYHVPCPTDPFLVWISPHAEHADDQARRAEHVRIIAATDPDGQRVIGIRSDAESHHYHYKRTLLVGRAMSLGWRRGLIDQYCYATLNNALTLYRHEHEPLPRERPWVRAAR